MPKAAAQKSPQTVVSVQAPTTPLHRREDPPRDERRALVKVRFREGAAPTVVAGQRTRPDQADDQGWVTLKPCYESDIARIEALIESDQATYEAAVKAHKRKFERYIARHVPKTANRDDENVASVISDLRRRYTGSIEAEFYSISGDERGILPLLEVKVLERDLDPPMSREERQTKTLVQSIVGRAQAAAGGAEADSSELEELRRENAELRSVMGQLAEKVEALATAAQSNPAADEKAEKASDESGKSKGRSK